MTKKKLLKTLRLLGKRTHFSRFLVEGFLMGLRCHLRVWLWFVWFFDLAMAKKWEEELCLGGEKNAWGRNSF